MEYFGTETANTGLFNIVLCTLNSNQLRQIQQNSCKCRIVQHCSHGIVLCMLNSNLLITQTYLTQVLVGIWGHLVMTLTTHKWSVIKRRRSISTVAFYIQVFQNPFSVWQVMLINVFRFSPRHLPIQQFPFLGFIKSPLHIL